MKIDFGIVFRYSALLAFTALVFSFAVTSFAVIKGQKPLSDNKIKAVSPVKYPSRYSLEQKIFSKDRQKKFIIKDDYQENSLFDTYVLSESIINDPMFYQGKVLPPPESYVLTNDVSVSIADAFNHRVIEVDPHPMQVMWDYGRIGTYSINTGYLHYPSFIEKIGPELFLITDLGNNRIIKLKKGDEGFGEIVWSYGNGEMGRADNQVFLAETAVELPNGNILITDTSNHRIIEVNDKREIVWQYGNFDRGTGHNWLDSPQGSSLTASPRQILIADTGNHRVIIVDKATKNIVWQYGTTASAGVSYNHLNLPNAAREIFGGNILITDSANHRVIEIDRKTRKIVWQYGNGEAGSGFDELNWPYNAYRLPNGNTFITDSDNHRVIEVDHYHRIVWQYGQTGVIGSGTDLLYAPYDAQITAKDSDYLRTDTNLDNEFNISDANELQNYLSYNPMKDIATPVFTGDILDIELNDDYPCDELAKLEETALNQDVSNLVTPYSFENDSLDIILDDAYQARYLAEYESDVNEDVYKDKISFASQKTDEYNDFTIPPTIQTPILAADKRLQYISKIEEIDQFSIFDTLDTLDRYFLMNYLSLRLEENSNIDDIGRYEDLAPVDTQTAYSYYPVSDYSISYLIRSYDYANIEPLKNLDSEYSQALAPHSYKIRDI